MNPLGTLLEHPIGTPQEHSRNTPGTPKEHPKNLSLSLTMTPGEGGVDIPDILYLRQGEI